LVYLALTSYPLGDSANQQTLAEFRRAIDAAFAQHDGILHVKKDIALFMSTKQTDL
jgi:hypothetical protein